MNTWLDDIRAANRAFRDGDATRPAHPGTRQPYALVTCMDPRINPAAVGIDELRAGAADNGLRIIRTVGAFPEPRSLLVAIHVSGVQEVAVMTHTDCGAAIVWNQTDAVIEKLQAGMGAEFQRFAAETGVEGADSLRDWVVACDDPRAAVLQHIRRLREEPYFPRHIPVHGLLYDVSVGNVEVVVDGYGES